MMRRWMFMAIMALAAALFIADTLPAAEEKAEKQVPGTAPTAPWVLKTLPEGQTTAEETMKEEEARKAEEAKKAEAEKKAAEEAQKVIVARVNGAEINMQMLVRAMNKVAPKYVKEGDPVSPETTAKIKGEALDRLIYEELAVQESVKKGKNPSPEAIDKVLVQIKENLGSEEAYREYLEKSFLTEETLKKLIERSQRFEMITADEVYGKVTVDEKLLQEEFEKEKKRYILPDNFVVEDVFILPGKDEETMRQKAGELLQTIRKNDNDVWKLVLDGTFIVRKISIKKERYPEVYKAMFDMKAGDLSGVIQEKDGLHIVKVVTKELSRQSTFEEARPTLEPRFLVPAQEQRKLEWEKELRKDAKIEILLESVEMKEDSVKQGKEKK